MRDPHARLVEILRERSYRRQTVVLESGRKTDYYIHGKHTTLNAEGAWLVAHLILRKLRNGPRVVGVGGPSHGADPIAGAVAAMSFAEGYPVHGFIVRRDPKGLGVGVWLEGRENLPPDSPVCIVEDSAASGGSMLTAILRAQADGLRVVRTITVVDRQEGAREALASHGFELEALVLREELERAPDP